MNENLSFLIKKYMNSVDEAFIIGNVTNDVTSIYWV
jgi:hypothetical protein